MQHQIVVGVDGKGLFSKARGRGVIFVIIFNRRMCTPLHKWRL